MILNVHCQFYAKRNIKSEDFFRDILENIPEELRHSVSTREFMFPVSDKESERIKKEGLFVVTKEGTDQKCFVVDELVVSFDNIEGCNLNETIEYVLSHFEGKATSYDLSERVHISSPN